MNALHTPLGVDLADQDLDRNSPKYLGSTDWRFPYDYGTVFYSPTDRWQAHVDLDHHILGIQLTPSIVRMRLNSGSSNSYISTSGSLYHVAAGSTIEVKNEQPIDFVLVTIDHDWHDRLFKEAGLRGALPLFSYNLEDPSVEKLARQIRQQFLRHDREIASLASSLVFKAIDRILDCSHFQRKPQRYALAPYQVRSTLDYINDNLASSLSVETLAQVAGLSGCFFAHAFAAMLGDSPHQYILDRRIARARDLITKTKSPLADIAYAVGFSSQSHMTSTFCKRFGVTPRALRHH